MVSAGFESSLVLLCRLCPGFRRDTDATDEPDLRDLRGQGRRIGSAYYCPVFGVSIHGRIQEMVRRRITHERARLGVRKGRNAHAASCLSEAERAALREVDHKKLQVIPLMKTFGINFIPGLV